MARRVFFSFHYERDAWRVQQVKNMGALEGQPILSTNDWENVKKGGKTAIQNWIDKEMSGRSCVVVLIGSKTAGREWVTYEISKGWNDGKGVVGVYIHNLKEPLEATSPKGGNPFDHVTFTKNKAKLSTVVKAYDPGGGTSQGVYDNIKKKLPSWVEEAISIRANYKEP